MTAPALSSPQASSSTPLMCSISFSQSQFFDDVRDVIRKAPAKELVDLPEGHDAKLGKTLA